MDVMELRRALLQPRIKTIGGIPVLFDNAYYRTGNGKINSFLTDNRFFITVAFDTGSTASKSYTMSQFNRNAYSIEFDAYSRWFDDLQGTSKDYWGMTTASSNTSRNLTSYGRYIVACVLKAEAGGFYIYDNTNQRFICKGKNVI